MDESNQKIIYTTPTLTSFIVHAFVYSHDEMDRFCQGRCFEQYKFFSH